MPLIYSLRAKTVYAVKRNPKVMAQRLLGLDFLIYRILKIVNLGNWIKELKLFG